MKILASSAAASGLPLRGAEPRRFAFTQWDVFTKKALTGNPLAVFADARGLPDADMQALARETNLSETTFIFRREAAVERERSGGRVTNVRVSGFAVLVMRGEYAL